MVDMNDVSRRMDASIVSLSNDFSGLRAGRSQFQMWNGSWPQEHTR